MSVILQDRLEAVKGIPLSVGCHLPPKDGETPCAFCAAEKWTWMRDLPWGDHPADSSPVLWAFIRPFHDHSDQAARDQIDLWVIENADRIAATEDDEHEWTRGFLAADWATRVALPLWLEHAGATDAAASLRARPVVGSRADAKAMREAINRIQRDPNYPSWIVLRDDLGSRVREAVTKALKEGKGADGAAEVAWAAGVAAEAASAWAAEAAWVAWAAGAAASAEAAGAAWAAEVAWAAGVAWAAEAAGAAEEAASAWAAEAAWAAEVAEAFRQKVYDLVRARILELWGEKFAEVTTPIKASAMELLEQMVSLGETDRGAV